MEREVQTPDGRWYTMRILPYRTLDNRIDGAVVTFTEVTRLKRLEGSLQRAKAYAESIIGTVREPLLVLDSDLRAVSANACFLPDVSGGPENDGWGILCTTSGKDNGMFRDCEGCWRRSSRPGPRSRISRWIWTFPGLGPRIMRLNARRMEPDEEQPALILLAIEDVTAREQARRQIEALAAELEARVQERTAELARTVAELEAEITERKRSEERILATNRLLALFARETTRAAYLESALALLQEAAGSCRCVGIRLRNERGEIPYEVSAGFSPEFLESESRLQLGRDECACTRIVSGRPLPCDASAMTAAGSFFCNDTSALVSRLTDEEKRSFRGVCVKAGFASVAVVPIRYNGFALGVIHLADEQPGMFTRDVVEFMESISPLIGEAAHRFSVEEELRKSEQRYYSLVAATSQMVWTTTAQGEVAGDIPSWRAFTGQSLEEIQGWGWSHALHPDDRERTAAIWSRAVSARSLYDTEYRIRRADGEYRYFAVRGVPVLEPNGGVREWVGTCTDITEHKRAEQEIISLNEEPGGASEGAHGGIGAFQQGPGAVRVRRFARPQGAAADGHGFHGVAEGGMRGRLDAKAGEYIGYAADAAARMQRLMDDCWPIPGSDGTRRRSPWTRRRAGSGAANLNGGVRGIRRRDHARCAADGSRRTRSN